MRISRLEDYELLDASSGQKLERFGEIVLIRPDPQIIWKTKKTHPLWNKAHAVYHRSKSGGGQWEGLKKIPDVWSISYKSLKFRLKPMGFKHVGIFPEQAVNWDLIADIVSKSKKKLKILNLFAYTGGATMAALNAGASVCHVDASKGMTLWAKENVNESGLQNGDVRFLVDDCIKFVQREKRRGNFYDGIIMDPPSYGRGPKGEIWKIEDSIYPFIQQTEQLLSDDPLFFLINSYTTGLAPSVLTYMISTAIIPKHGGSVESGELGLPVSGNGLVLPCGASGRWSK